jgi:hypothetical protein
MNACTCQRSSSYDPKAANINDCRAHFRGFARARTAVLKQTLQCDDTQDSAARSWHPDSPRLASTRKRHLCGQTGLMSLGARGVSSYSLHGVVMPLSVGSP